MKSIAMENLSTLRRNYTKENNTTPVRKITSKTKDSGKNLGINTKAQIVMKKSKIILVISLRTK